MPAIKLAHISLRAEPAAGSPDRPSKGGEQGSLSSGQEVAGEWSAVIRRLLAWGPPAAWALILFLLSEIRETPDIARPFLAFSDKLVHFGLYFALGALLALGRRIAGGRAPHLALIAIGAVYGALDEWHQSFVPRRSPDFADWLADLAGVAIGYALLTVSDIGRNQRTQGRGTE